MTHLRVQLEGLMLAVSLVAAAACQRQEPTVTVEPATTAAPHSEQHPHEQKGHTAAVQPEGRAQTGEHAEHAGHAHRALPLDAPLAGTSVYNLEATFTDQHGKAFDFAAVRGSAVLTTMFYASCTSICPLLISQLKWVDEKLPPDVRAKTQVVLVSLDPERDDAEKLQALAKQHGIDDPRWHFLRTPKDHVREVAAVLGVRYASLPDGEISHSPVIALLDREGAIVTRSEVSSGEMDSLVAATARVVGKDI